MRLICPFRCVTRVGTAQSHIEEKASFSGLGTAIIDPVTGWCLIESSWGSHPRQGALRPTLASALHGRGLPKPKKGENSSGGADVSAAKAIKPNVAEEALRSLSRDGQSASTVEEIAVPPRHLARSLRQSAAGTEQVSVR